MITVCTSSTETQLANLGDLMVLLGATASSSGMDLALTQATDWVERYITGGGPQGSIRRQVYAETLAGYDSPRLMLSRTPVQAIQRMFDNPTTSQATEYCSTEYALEDPEAGFLEMRNNTGFMSDQYASWSFGSYRTMSVTPMPTAVNRRWLVVYEAGWTLNPTTCADTDYPTGIIDRTLPGIVERAILMKAQDVHSAEWMNNVDSEQLGDLRVNYSSGSKDGSSKRDSAILDMLAPYRRF